MPQMKDLVPSIGSSTQTYSASGIVGAEFLADHAMLGKRPLDQRAHRRFGGAVGGGHRIEAAGAALVFEAETFGAERAAEKRPDGLARNGGELVHECREVDRRHAAPSAVAVRVPELWPNGNRGRDLIGVRQPRVR